MNTSKGKAPAPTKTQGAFKTDTVGEQLTFLDPLPFCPTWPKRGSLEDRALEMFMSGRLLDHPDFEAETASWRLAAVVCDLRDLGWPIESIDIPSPTEECQNRFIALYRLPSKYAAQAQAMCSAS
jgi:hypothetical protein